MNKKWFTLVELIVSVSIISILSIVIWWFLSQISKNFYDNSNDLQIYSNIINFQNQITKNDFNSWIVIKNINYYDSLVLKNSFNSGWIIIWIFDKNSSMIDNELKEKTSATLPSLWYFFIDDYFYILNNTWSIYTGTFNKWETFPNLNISNFEVKEYNTWTIFDLNIKVNKNKKTNIPLKKEDILEFNLYF